MLNIVNVFTQVVATRQDKVVTVTDPIGMHVVEHSDGTRITTQVHIEQISTIDENALETGMLFIIQHGKLSFSNIRITMRTIVADKSKCTNNIFLHCLIFRRAASDGE